MSIMSDNDVIIYAKKRKIYFKQWDFEVHCTIPKTPSRPPKFDRKWYPKNRAKTKPPKPKRNISKGPTKPILWTSKKYAQINTIDTTINAEKPFIENTSITIDTIDIITKVQMNDMIEYYRDLLLKEFNDILINELSNKLSSLREINHQISFKSKMS